MKLTILFMMMTFSVNLFAGILYCDRYDLDNDASAAGLENKLTFVCPEMYETYSIELSGVGLSLEHVDTNSSRVFFVCPDLPLESMLGDYIGLRASAGVLLGVEAGIFKKTNNVFSSPCALFGGGARIGASVNGFKLSVTR